MPPLLANALTDLFKSVTDNPTVGGVIGLAVVLAIVAWALNGGKAPASPPPKADDQKEKEAVEAALKAYKDAKK